MKHEKLYFQTVTVICCIYCFCVIRVKLHVNNYSVVTIFFWKEQARTPIQMISPTNSVIYVDMSGSQRVQMSYTMQTRGASVVKRSTITDISVLSWCACVSDSGVSKRKNLLYEALQLITYAGNFPCGGRIPVVTMVWVASRFRLKVETSSTRSQKSINSDWTHKRSPRWRGPHHVREATS